MNFRERFEIPEEITVLRVALLLFTFVVAFCSLWIRFPSAGLLFLFLLPIWLYLIFHHIRIQFLTIFQIEKLASESAIWLFISNVFLFLVFALQMDHADSSVGYIAIFYYYSRMTGQDMWSLQPSNPGMYSKICVVSFVALVFCWIRLTEKHHIPFFPGARKASTTKGETQKNCTANSVNIINKFAPHVGVAICLIVVFLIIRRNNAIENIKINKIGIIPIRVAVEEVEDIIKKKVNEHAPTIYTDKNEKDIYYRIEHNTKNVVGVSIEVSEDARGNKRIPDYWCLDDAYIGQTYDDLIIKYGNSFRVRNFPKAMWLTNDRLGVRFTVENNRVVGCAIQERFFD